MHCFILNVGFFILYNRRILIRKLLPKNLQVNIMIPKGWGMPVISHSLHFILSNMFSFHFLNNVRFYRIKLNFNNWYCLWLPFQKVITVWGKVYHISYNDHILPLYCLWSLKLSFHLANEISLTLVCSHHANIWLDVLLNATHLLYNSSQY